VFGAIVEEQRSLCEIFQALGDILDNHNWLITEFDVYNWGDRAAFFQDLRERDSLWLDGEALREILKADDFFTMWCVVSGFKKDVPPEAVLSHPLPCADGNTGFWVDDPALQNPLAELEIVEFDGSECFILSRDAEPVERFRRAFEGAYDLIADNRAVNRMIRRIESVILSMGLGWDEQKQDCLKWKVYHALFKGQTSQPDDDQIQASLLEDRCSACRWPWCRKERTNG
jgi:hypothetical protein